jgi:CHRD domain
MKRRTMAYLAYSVAAGSLLAVTTVTMSGQGHRKLKADLDGFQETPQTLSTPASGEFEARLVSESMLEYELTYSGFQTAVSAAHIHLGRPATSGGVVTFLCGGGGKPACPQGSGRVTGTIAPADIMGLVGQGLAAGDFERFVAALFADATYANVHTAAYPGGEIRGAIE